jgi:hypothetical protein
MSSGGIDIARPSIAVGVRHVASSFDCNLLNFASDLTCFVSDSAHCFKNGFGHSSARGNHGISGDASNRRYRSGKNNLPNLAGSSHTNIGDIKHDGTHSTSGIQTASHESCRLGRFPRSFVHDSGYDIFCNRSDYFCALCRIKTLGHNAIAEEKQQHSFLNNMIMF